MTHRIAATLALLTLGALASASPAGAIGPSCTETFAAECFGLESVSASLSTTRAGAHPDLSFGFEIKQDPDAPTDIKGLHGAYAPARNVRIETPPGLIGDPNVLGAAQQCTALELSAGECPNGSQIGIAKVTIFNLGVATLNEPLYMMVPPGGSDVLARVGFVGGPVGASIYADIKLRSESDYGLNTEIATPDLRDRGLDLIATETTLWGVPSAKVHDTERCTPGEVFPHFCTVSPVRKPGNRALPFLTNPTRCGVPLSLSVAASSWAEPERFDKKTASFPEISGCDKLPFGPSVTIEPTSHHTFVPSGLDLTMTLPRAEGVEVLEPAQIRDIRIDLPEGVTVNPGSADGLGVCSVSQVHFGERVAAECPDSAKMASTEFEIGGLPRRMKGAIYLREPEPGNLYRIWVVADDLGAHVKLAGQLEVDEETGQLRSVLLENPQAPLREVKLLFKSGFRAPLMTPKACGTYFSHYEFTPWSGGPPKVGDTSMEIDEGCNEAGGFSPKLVAGSTDARAGAFSPFTFTLTREDPEENIAALDLTLPKGMAASFAGVARCEGIDAETGNCPADSRVGKIVAATGAGPAPLWVPQPGKDPTAIYLSGPYKGAPLSIVAVVPAQAGPFDLGLQVVRSAIFVDNETAQATARSDALPQIIEGIPVTYKTVNAQLDRPNFSLNPTSCAAKQVQAHLTSIGGKEASPTYPFAATDCGRLGFAPRLAARIFGPTNRGPHPRFKAVVKMPSGGANLAGTQVTLPKSEFLDQAHFVTICTRVQFRAHECPAGATYGHVTARSPLFDFPLEGDVLLRSSDRDLPDLVFVLHGPASLPVEVAVVGHVDSLNGRLRTTFEEVPDAPVEEVVVEMAGGSKGLLQNTEGVCDPKNRLTAFFSAQNGRRLTSHPKLQANCKGKARKHKRHHKRHNHR